MFETTLKPIETLEIQFFLCRVIGFPAVTRKRKGRGKEKEKKRKGSGKEAERKRKGKGKSEERK